MGLLLLLLGLAAGCLQEFPGAEEDGSGPISWECADLITDAGGSDLWPITWSDDGHQYTAWGDGPGFQGSTYYGYGIARIEGNPTNYAAIDVGEFSQGGGGGKISGMISLAGVLYMWRFDQLEDAQHTLLKSTDKGSTVVETNVVFPKTGAPNMAPGPIINFGQDNADAIDAYVYSIAGDWFTSDPVYLIRVPAAQVENSAAYEVFSGTPGSPSWSTDFADRQPIYSDPTASTVNGATHTVITYFPGLDRFVLTAHHADDMGKWSIHEGEDPWGPWTEIARYSKWCGWTGQSTTEMLMRYIAPKWISAAGTEFWMVFSGTGTWDRFNLIQGTFRLQ